MPELTQKLTKFEIYLTSGENYDPALSLGVVVTCGLGSAQIHHEQMHRKGGPILSVQQEVSQFDVWRHFCPIHAYFENYLVLELKHHSLHINSIIIFMP